MRVEGSCCGDCAKCQLLVNGEVDMIPCVLDQMFRRLQTFGSELEALQAKVDGIAAKDVRLADKDD